MINKWDIFFCDSHPTQARKPQGTRTVLVISNDAVNQFLPVSTVLPLSIVKPGEKTYPTEVLLPALKTGLPKDCVAMVQQIRTVSHVWLINNTGKLTDELLQEQVNEALRQYFEI
jgi:mRNA interferase MazF